MRGWLLTTRVVMWLALAGMGCMPCGIRLGLPVLHAKDQWWMWVVPRVIVIRVAGVSMRN